MPPNPNHRLDLNPGHSQRSCWSHQSLPQTQSPILTIMKSHFCKLREVAILQHNSTSPVHVPAFNTISQSHCMPNPPTGLQMSWKCSFHFYVSYNFSANCIHSQVLLNIEETSEVPSQIHLISHNNHVPEKILRQRN